MGFYAVNEFDEQVYVRDEIDDAVDAELAARDERAVVDLVARINAAFSPEEIAEIEEAFDADGFDFVGTIEQGGSDEIHEWLEEREQGQLDAQAEDARVWDEVREGTTEHFGRALSDDELASLGRHADDHKSLDGWEPEHKLDSSQGRAEYYAKLIADREEHEPHLYTDEEARKLSASPHEMLMARVRGDAWLEEDEDGDEHLAVAGVDEDDEPDFSTHRSRMDYYAERLPPEDDGW